MDKNKDEQNKECLALYNSSKGILRIMLDVQNYYEDGLLF